MRRFLLPLLLSLAVLAALAPAAQAVPTMSLVDPITDNYKASYNADPSVHEQRTWLSMLQLAAGGTTWTPTDRADAGIGDISVTAADGRTGTLHVAAVGGTLSELLWRIDDFSDMSGGRWGPRATVGDTATLRATPVLFNLSLTVDGSVLAYGRVSYRYDAAFANAPTDSIEYNGPGGRWWVGGTRTRTDQEATPDTPPTILAAFPPSVVGLSVPTRTAQRVITARVFTRAGTSRVTYVRFSIAGRAFGRWLPVASSYPLTLPTGTALRTIKAQARDSRGLTSNVVSRRVRCTC